MNMIICPKCKAQTPEDSLFCDQCGTEILYCPSCKKPARGKRCTSCGSALVSASEFFELPEDANVTQPQPASSGFAKPQLAGQKATEPESRHNAEPQTFDEGTMRPNTPSGPTKLVGEGVVLLKSGGIIGRKNGDYLEIFSCQPYVSSTHARLDFNSGRWTITDLDSTNGTFINGEQIAPNTPTPFSKGDIITLATTNYTVE